MKHLKKLTLLHSNDMHGDFMAKEVDDRLIGGVSMLSGYVGKVRREERNVVRRYVPRLAHRQRVQGTVDR